MLRIFGDFCSNVLLFIPTTQTTFSYLDTYITPSSARVFRFGHSGNSPLYFSCFLLSTSYVPATQFLAHYSISYEFNTVKICSLNAPWVCLLLVSTYLKFCDTYSNPGNVGRIFAILVSPFTLPLFISVHRTSIIDINAQDYVVPLLPSPFPISLPECPPSIRVILFRIFYYIGMFLLNFQPGSDALGPLDEGEGAIVL